MTLLEAALDYAARGWHVFPCTWIEDGACSCKDPECGSPGKHPLTPQGFLDATNDPELVRDFWRKFPKANIAIRTGAASGLAVVDIDDIESAKPELEKLLPDYNLRSVPMQKTGKGWHLVFAYPGVHVKNGTKFLPGMDSRGDGGYIMAAPSGHISGAKYHWKVLLNGTLPLLPDALLKAINGPSNGDGTKARFDTAEALKGVPQGQQRVTIFKLACKLRHADVPFDIARKLILEAAGNCEPPLAEREALGQFESAYKRYEAGDQDRDRFEADFLNFDTAARLRQEHQNGNGHAADHQEHNVELKLAPEALHGLAGKIVRLISPYSEADPVALLLNILAAFGNVAGCSAYATAGHDEHPPRLFIAQVGMTSKGRKGSGWSPIKHVFSMIDSKWSKDRVKTGLSSGEGLIWNVRDPIYKKEAIKEKGRVTGDYQEVMVDPGVDDKRLMVIEPEFAATLTVMGREGNILSAIMRQAWDEGDLSPLTKNNPITATGAHISIIGHITQQELLARMDDTSKANGFANRFLWALVRRSKELPEGAEVPEILLQEFAEDLGKAIDFAHKGGIVKRDDPAREEWARVYGPLSAGRPGLTGAILSRAEAQVLRLSVLYALLDCTLTVSIEHLKAALALWAYCEASAESIFGNRLGYQMADRILEAIRDAGDGGMTDNDIYELFGGNRSARERERAMGFLKELKLIRSEPVPTGGRPKTIWWAT